MADAAKELLNFMKERGAVIQSEVDEAEDLTNEAQPGTEAKPSSGGPKSEDDSEKDSEEGDKEPTSEEDEVVLEVKAHTELVEKWCELAKKNLRTIGRLIPDNREAEKRLVKLLGGYLAPQLRSLKQLESTWDKEGRDVKTRAGMICTRIMLEYILAGLVEGLKLNQKELDKAKEPSEEDYRNNKGTGKPQMRFMAANEEEEESEASEAMSEASSTSRDKEHKRRWSQIDKLLQAVSLQYVKLLKISLRMIPHDAEIQLKGGWIRKGKRMQVRPHLLKLMEAHQKVVNGITAMASSDSDKKAINNQFVVQMYVDLIWALVGKPLKLMKLMVR